MIYIDRFTEWTDEYGMLNSEKGVRSENGILWSLEFFLLISTIGVESRYWAMTEFFELTRQLKIGEGLYIQTPFDLKSTDGGSGLEPVSHDNLTAIIAGSYFFNHPQVARQVWKYLKSKLFTYNSETKKIDFKRIMHPRDIIYYGAMAGNRMCKLLLPLVGLTNIWSCLRGKNKTSGKLLAYVRNICYRDSTVMKITHKICTFIINRKYGKEGWHGAFKIYFSKPGHPTAEISKKLFYRV